MNKINEFEYGIVVIVTTLLFVIPIILTLYKFHRKLNFKISKIHFLFNISLLLQIGLGIIFYLTFLTFGEVLFENYSNTKWFEIISTATLWYSVIGIFYYVPFLILLNIIIILINLIRKKKPAHNTG